MSIEIFSAVTSCIALALQIHDYFQNQLTDVPIDSLILSIKNDTAILNDFSRIFEAAMKDDNISQADKLLLNEICVSLRPTLINLQAWIIRRKTANLDASAARQFTNTVVDFLWKQSELEKVSAGLFQWTGRYYIRLGLLPLALKERLLADPSGNASEASPNLRGLRETFKGMTLRSQNAQDVDLKRVDGVATPRVGANSSRIFATMGTNTIIIEFKGHNSNLSANNLADFEIEVTKLARLLNGADAQLCRILKGIGYFYQPARSCFAFLYQIPRNISVNENATSPSSLLDLIKSTRKSTRDPSKIELLPPQHPLEQRFEVARKVACAVMYTHIMGYVHKSIRTSNIIMLTKTANQEAQTPGFPKYLGEPFLCGFETARHDKATSDQQGDAHWQYNIYRHPKRQGLEPQERYTMNHDIYSLGVVLLELGLWKPLLMTGLSKLKDSTPEDISHGVVRDYLKTLALENLPILVGTKYCEIVLFCLGVAGDGEVASSIVVEEVLGKLEGLAMSM